MKHKLLKSSLAMLTAASFAVGAQDLTETESVEVIDNASSPLAKLNFVDVRARDYDVTVETPYGSQDLDRTIYSIDGVTMLSEDDRLAYKFNYADIDFLGQNHKEMSNIEISYAHIFSGGNLFGIDYKAGAGFEWNKNLGNLEKGTGSGRDLITPQGGVGWLLGPTTQFLTLGQYFMSYDEDRVNGQKLEDIDMPAARVIFMHMFQSTYSWVFVDNKLVFDRNNDNKSGNMLEVQVGQMLNPNFGIYVEAYNGSGASRQYDKGFGLGLRFML